MKKSNNGTYLSEMKVFLFTDHASVLSDTTFFALTEMNIIQMAEVFIKTSYTTPSVAGFCQKWVTYVLIQTSR